MRLADYRKKEPYEKAEGARRTVGRAIRRDFPPKPPLDAANELAVITDIMERNRGLYGYDVPPAPRFRSGRKAYEAETARMAGHLGLLGEVGTAQATVGEAEKGRLGQIGAAREHGRAWVEATGIAGEATLGAEAKRGRSLETVEKYKTLAALLGEGMPFEEAWPMAFPGQKLPGGLGMTVDQIDAETKRLKGPQTERVGDEEIEVETRPVFQSRDRTPTIGDIRQTTRERLGIIPERIRRARRLMDIVGR